MTRRLLIVDDSKVMRDMVAACLRPLDEVSFEFAASGLEAIERLALASYELVVLDLNMPDVGGLEVIEFIRSQDKLRALQILVVTTRGDETSKTRVDEGDRGGRIRLSAQTFRTRADPDRGQGAHDLRTPLQTLLMGCECVRMVAGDNKKAQQFADRMQAASSSVH